MKFFSKSSSVRTLRPTLLALHTSGVICVFRRHSIFRLWVPLRENFVAEERFLG